MKAGSIIILRIRAEKALGNMKLLLQGADNKDEVKALVAESWQRAEMSGMGAKESITFEYDINEEDFIGKLLPI